MRCKILPGLCPTLPGPRILWLSTAAVWTERWRYAIEDTQIATDWILRLDADYQVSNALVAEIAALDPNAPVSAYRVSFDYAIFSHKLRSSLYPANTVLLRRGSFSVG